jgi:hypothetical protein
MSASEPTSPEPMSPASLPPAPWILVDRTIVEQSAAVFERLEQWLDGGNPTAAKLCARACSVGEADADEVAAWLGTLTAHLHRRVQDSGQDSDKEVDSWS